MAVSAFGQAPGYEMQTILGSYFKNPSDLAVGADGEFYVLENPYIAKISADGKHQGWIEPSGGSEDRIFVDEKQNLFLIAEAGIYEQLYKFDSAGNFVMEITFPEPEHTYHIDALRADGEQHLYVLIHKEVGRSYLSKVLQFDAEGNYLNEIVLDIIEEGYSYNDLAFDAIGNIYALESGHYRINKFSSSGRFLSHIMATGTSHFYKSLEVDGNGVVNAGYSDGIDQFDADGQFLRAILAGREVIALAIDQKNKKILHVLIDDPYQAIMSIENGEITTVIEQQKWPQKEYQGIAFDRYNNCYLFESDHQQIVKYTPAGTLIGQLPLKMNKDGRFLDPVMMLLDRFGDFYLLEEKRLLKFSGAGNLLYEISDFGPTDTHYAFKGIALTPTGQLYIADNAGNCVRKLDATGKYLDSFKTTGQGAELLNGPQGVTLDEAGNVYVAQQDGRNVQKFSSDGQFLQHFGKPSSFYRGDEPEGIIIDAYGNVWTTTANDWQLRVWNSQGDLLSETSIWSNHLIAISPNKGIMGVTCNWLTHVVYQYTNREYLPTAFSTITGRVYGDNNENCKWDTSDTKFNQSIITVQPGSYYGYPDQEGRYAIQVDTGTYYVNQLLPDLKRWQWVEQTCPTNPSYHRVQVSTQDTTVTDIDFGNYLVQVPYLTVAVSSDRRRRCFRSTTTVRYTNDGAAPASPVEVKVKYPEYVVPISSTMPWSRVEDDNVYVFVLGTLAPHRFGTIQITDSVVCGIDSIRGLTQCTEAQIFPRNLRDVDPNWDQSEVKLTATCLDNGFVRFVVRNQGLAMQDSSAYRLYLDAQLVYQAKLKLVADDSLVFRVPVNGQTVRLEADQRPGHPYQQQTHLTLEGCGTNVEGAISYGYVAQLPPDDEPEEISVSCLPIIDSFDPNDKLALPTGRFAQHYLRPDVALQYTIRFQNTGTDTAYRVVIVDTLDAGLDLSTLQQGASSHPYQFSLSGKGRAVLTWTFTDIDLPDSTRNEPASHGYVSFSIRPYDTLPELTRVENEADIYFDFNAPVHTNLVFHTLTDSVFADFTKMPPIEFEAVTTTSAALDRHVQLYPNPSAGYFQLKWAEAPHGSLTLEVVDLMGRTVWRKSVRNQQEVLEEAIDLRLQPAGLYSLRVQTPAGQLLRKIVIQ
ncbi:conserved repeat domain-containing protein/Por secretion system C-terminal sorting domain-containing protein [Catalinimonas alkaloidigena]|uniref:Conserved repeat domain-containing protein/Por secretion system C-terminal sorting domain-containing protein n=2 Tax=Catalinimonas alkaloidigena TaxID=1075417 RepID=A0A1G9RQW7_9BACT|nr:conserved repeat domain-containing protein/Por secretion system C-terminal sorting domain-containing protein [Catalinimonas alkaloidigena]